MSVSCRNPSASCTYLDTMFPRMVSVRYTYTISSSVATPSMPPSPPPTGRRSSSVLSPWYMPYSTPGRAVTYSHPSWPKATSQGVSRPCSTGSSWTPVYASDVQKASASTHSASAAYWYIAMVRGRIYSGFAAP